MTPKGVAFLKQRLFFFSQIIIKKGERTSLSAQKDDVERRRDRGKQRVLEVVSTRRRLGRRVSCLEKHVLRMRDVVDIDVGVCVGE